MSRVQGSLKFCPANVALILFTITFASLAHAQQQCTPHRPAGNFTRFGNLSADYGPVPIGLSVVHFLSGYGASSELQVAFSASLDACSDPDFASLGTNCTSTDTGTSCSAVVAFMPTRPGPHSAILYGDINVSDYTYPSGYVQPGFHELDTVNLTGYGVGGPACNPTLTVTLSNPQVAPAKTSLSNQTLVTIQLNDTSNAPGCIAGKVIEFSSQPNEMTGGHLHAGPRPSGSFSQYFCTTNSSGACQVQFQASEVAGTEKILASLSGSSTTMGMAIVTIQVPNLQDFTNFAGILNGTLLRLTGADGNPFHPNNHFIRPSNEGKVLGIAVDVFQDYQASIGFNDMSLPQGGLFDIGPKKGPFWASPHALHREGKSVDIDHCAQSAVANNRNSRGDCPVGWVNIPRRAINGFCARNKGRLENEDTFHCEFY